jgi:AraC-like DNA-binding protein
MRNSVTLIILLLFSIGCTKQFPETLLTGPEIIERSIRYHDLNGAWSELKASFLIQDSLPAGKDSRFYEFSLDNSQSKMVYRIKGLNYIVWNDSVQVFEGEVENERALRMRNYYTYLWGLPMKLTDPNTRIEEKVSLEEAAQLSNLSVSAFSRFFKSRVNKSFSDFLTEVRISNACKLLHETDLNISEISYECGFFTISNFNKLFKEQVKMTPLQYRREFLQTFATG